MSLHNSSNKYQRYINKYISNPYFSVIATFVTYLLLISNVLISQGCHSFNSFLPSKITEQLILPLLGLNFISIIWVLFSTYEQSRKKYNSIAFTLTSLFISALLLIIFSFASVFIPTVVAETRCAYSPINQRIAVTNALEWSRLLELSDSAHNIEAKTLGISLREKLKLLSKLLQKILISG